MKTPKLRSISTAAVLVSAMLSPASAQTLTVPNPNRVISWNLDDTGTITPGDLAGIAPAYNWNNSWPDNPTIGLLDNSGVATTMDLGYRGFNTYHVVNFHPGIDANGTANRELLNGYLNAGPAAWNPAFTNTYVSLTNVPYARYDVLVYFNSDTSGRRGTIDNGTTAFSFSTVAAPSVTGANALFLLTSVTNSASYPSANFAFFHGMTNANAFFNELPKSGNDQWLGIAGLQVVESSNVWVVYGPTPANQTVPIGQPASFSVVAGGFEPRYQWRHNESPISNATNATYTIASTVTGQQGAYDVVISNSFSSVTSLVANLTFYTPRTLRWNGAGSDWDTNSLHWTANNGVSTTAYVETDIVRLDPLGSANPFVNLTGERTPSAIVVSNASYTFSGGALDGNGSLTVVNNGLLVLSTVDNRSGPTTIASGSALEVGTGGVLGAGALTNNGGLIFNLGVDQAYGFPIHGTGSVTNRGGAGRITLGGSVTGGSIVQEGAGELLIQGQNSLSGGLLVQGGIAIARSEGSFGGGPVVLAGGELQVPFTFIFPSSPLTFAGGTLNSGGSSIFEGSVTLLADATVTVTGGNTVFSNAAGISGTGFNLTKTGAGTLTLAGTTNRWASLSIVGGALRIGLGGAAGGLGSGTVQNDSVLEFDLSGSITVPNTIAGFGIVNQMGTGTTALAGDQSGFTGSYNVTNGTLLVNATSSANAANVIGGSFGGNGTIAGSVDVMDGAALTPAGAAVGTLTLGGNLNLNGNLLIDVNRSLSQSNDLVVVTGSAASASTGTITVNNLGSALIVGNSFKLFNQPVAGAEQMTVSGGGMTWTNRLAQDGTIAVTGVATVSQPRITTTIVSGGSLVFSGTNGVAGNAYQVYSATNLATPLSSWTLSSSGTFDSNGNFSVTNAVNSGEPQRFYILRLP